MSKKDRLHMKFFEKTTKIKVDCASAHFFTQILIDRRNHAVSTPLNYTICALTGKQKSRDDCSSYDAKVYSQVKLYTQLLFHDYGFD